MNEPHKQQEGQGKEHGPQVTFEHVNSLAKVKLAADWDSLISALWEAAYSELGEPHRPDDRLQGADGSDLMGYLGLTLRQAQDQKILHGHHFQIVGPTGGASA